MIEFKDLEDKRYEGRDCVAFTVRIVDEKQNEILKVSFNRHKNNHKLWIAFCTIGRTKVKDTDVYALQYEMPKENMNIELIAASGLRLLDMEIKEEIQKKIEVDFAIGEATSGM